jgi:hypothetical protein
LHIQEYVSTEDDDEYYSEWQAGPALSVLHHDIGDIDPTKVKLVSPNNYTTFHIGAYSFPILHTFFMCPVPYGGYGGGDI